MKRWLSTTLLIVFVAVFLISGFFLGRYFIESRKEKNTYDGLAQIMEQARPVPTEDQTPDTPTVSIDPEDTDTATEPQPSDNQLVTVHDPVTGQPVELLPELAELYLLNPDLAGWITVEGTSINYPVMHTPDRPDYYLYRNFYKEDSAHGCIYMREACMPGVSDNLVIYGHRMKDGSMFNNLLHYEDRDYYESHKYIQFSTLTERHTYQIIAVFKTVATESGYPYHLFTYAESPEEFDRYVADVKALAFYDTGVSAQYGDKLITLSTCEYTQDNGRMVVVAKRIG